MVTHADGVSCHELEAFQDLSGPEGVQRARLLISTEKAGDVVLLRIDSLAPALPEGGGCPVPPAAPVRGSTPSNR